MKSTRRILLLVIMSSIGLFQFAFSQVSNNSSLSIKEIMSENYIGYSPRSIQWSEDSQKLFFYWNPGTAKADSAYQISPKDLSPTRIEADVISQSTPERGTFNKKKTHKLVNSQKGILLIDLKKKDTFLIYSTAERISSPQFSFDESLITFSVSQNLFSWNRETGQLLQLTNFQKDKPERNSPERKEKTEQDKKLEADQKILFPKLSQQRNRFSGQYSRYGNRMGQGSSGGPETYYLEGFSVYGTQLSPDNQYITVTMGKRSDIQAESTKMPDYVTSTGYTEIRNTRSKVGSLPSEMKLEIFNLNNNTNYTLELEDLPGIFDAPEYYAEYPGRDLTYDSPKPISLSGPKWSEDGQYGVMTAQSSDNKDRWIFLLDLATGKPKILDHQHDEAWISGPGIGYGGSVGWMPDQKRIYFQSELSGYSHLYTINVESGDKKALTSGNFEVYSPFLSDNKKFWYFSSNEVHPGERHFYRMPLDGGERVQLTSMVGSNSVNISPDEKYLAITFSFANRPPELYFQANKPEAEAIQITDGRSTSFKEYDWKVPEFIDFKAADGTTVYARIYQPEAGVKNKAAVIFVHGAGYLQNAHKWWSSYYHEYMFHHILLDNGYTVLDIDYRGSAGYGRDCRTGIYRWMGGKDLSDQVDGAKLLAQKYGIESEKIGLYGGSYGGFITLMAMFNEPDVFAAGAALRSVTDWAHYNHGYTANILNTPVEDSIAYAQSSPIYFAEGLKGNLLMCHGILDDNVHFQDIVRVSQRLIDLGKDNWELAAYPLQRHSFTDPDAWTDEYKRIFKLFQNTIGKK